jgi:hypothetical protein
MFVCFEQLGWTYTGICVTAEERLLDESGHGYAAVSYGLLGATGVAYIKHGASAPERLRFAARAALEH